MRLRAVHLLLRVDRFAVRSTQPDCDGPRARVVATVRVVLHVTCALVVTNQVAVADVESLLRACGLLRKTHGALLDIVTGKRTPEVHDDVRSRLHAPDVTLAGDGARGRVNRVAALEDNVDVARVLDLLARGAGGVADHVR